MEVRQFLDGLYWYLEARNWAREKITTLPHGTSGRDITMFHFVYFSNALGAMEFVKDFLPENLLKKNFVSNIVCKLSSENDLEYFREFRNAIVHRGLVPDGAGADSDGFRIFVLCPVEISDRKGKEKFKRPCRYTFQLAELIDNAVNRAIVDFLNSNNILDVHAHLLDRAEVLESLDHVEHMPDWAKSMSRKFFESGDFEAKAIELANSRVEQFRALLGITPQNLSPPTPDRTPTP